VFPALSGATVVTGRRATGITITAQLNNQFANVGAVCSFSPPQWTPDLIF
jgi:ABC-type Zn2+ transport system substrate-binding protein/surface adhesin